jgi:hypothetical protein
MNFLTIPQHIEIRPDLPGRTGDPRFCWWNRYPKLDEWLSWIKENNNVNVNRIMIDCSPTEIAAIRQVFDDVAILLCHWKHIFSSANLMWFINFFSMYSISIEIALFIFSFSFLFWSLSIKYLFYLNLLTLLAIVYDVFSSRIGCSFSKLIVTCYPSNWILFPDKICVDLTAFLFYEIHPSSGFKMDLCAHKHSIVKLFPYKGILITIECLYAPSPNSFPWILLGRYEKFISSGNSGF